MIGTIRAILFDCGDTLVDEGSEEKDAAWVTLRAALIPGAAEAVRILHQRGYPLALVADGPEGTFTNVLNQHGLADFFAIRAISGLLGCQKPDRRMFEHALNHLGIDPQDYPRVVMVGNHLSRDIKGANALGLISVWLDWAPRRAKIPADASEQPTYTIKSPSELPGLIETLEQTLSR